ncbi:glycosyl hydrolase family 28-related protein [Mesorhizobium sp. M2A.F.Ca.ET.039.01.1.1]|uniref:right-handed parallel beta-helix repeat-containing protein n=1 Tax=Mesorhizobium sp. M2A.F.Ca.ET.039.01.1.1 TaxID=2496746 RepID=UPI000FCB1D32|nr:glycosyl hydrolase family 28-related protein [Mesorhizobium sp. M2A.F.Ca.ET.039.01.1.1]RWX71885.1 hypothetical protein EOA24_04270 [Mesorhizobium sp. M2A.F.Ca.ET.039.01.1.1]TIV48079.1 MAG: hypothetical protein E5V96_00260 [Mesorhizobium sp.]
MVELAKTIWRDFVTDGVPASGPYKPQKTKIREWGTFVESLSGGVNVLTHGAIADDATDNTAAFQAAITEALANGGGVVYIPAGKYWFSEASASLDPGVGNLIFRGEGWDATVLHFEEGSDPNAGDPNYKSLFLNAANSAKGSVRFEHLQFKGTLPADNIRHGGVPAFLDYYTDVIFHACKFLQLTGMAMDVHFCKRFECTNCWFEDIAADCVRARDTPNVLVDGNFILRNGDDAIAIHTSDGSATGTREGVIVTNNHLVNAGCIKVLGGRVVHVIANRIELGNLSAIQVANAATTVEGNYPLRDIIIADNIMLDTLSITGAVPNTNHSCIVLSAVPSVGQASTHNTRPGRYDVTGAAWIFPWTYDEVDVDNAASVVPPVFGILVSGNIIRRSRPAVAAFSNYGVGTRLWQGVSYDPAITDAYLRPSFGVFIGGGSFTGLAITENIIECVGNFISFPAPTYNLQYEHVLISRNITRDILNRCVLLTTAAFTVDISVEDNDFDGDTYRQNANSNINGSYLAASVPRGVDCGSLVGVKVRRNRFRNVCQALAANIPAQLLIEGNILACAPATLGFSTSNKGVGDVLQADGKFLYEIIDADPTSATYGANTNTQQLAATAMPTTGTYVQGAFVRNSSPTQANGIEGWLRLSTGNAHVLGTDWMIVGGRLTGTATFDPASLADGAGATTTVTVAGAALGDAAVASFSLDTQGITITAWVSAANTVSVRFQNESGGTLDIASGTLKATVFR